MTGYCKISTCQLSGVLRQHGVESHQFNRGSASPGAGWYLTPECYDLKHPLCGQGQRAGARLVLLRAVQQHRHGRALRQHCLRSSQSNLAQRCSVSTA